MASGLSRPQGPHGLRVVPARCRCGGRGDPAPPRALCSAGSAGEGLSLCPSPNQLRVAEPAARRVLVVGSRIPPERIAPVSQLGTRRKRSGRVRQSGVTFGSHSVSCHGASGAVEPGKPAAAHVARKGLPDVGHRPPQTAASVTSCPGSPAAGSRPAS